MNAFLCVVYYGVQSKYDYVFIKKQFYIIISNTRKTEKHKKVWHWLTQNLKSLQDVDTQFTISRKWIMTFRHLTKCIYSCPCEGAHTLVKCVYTSLEIK
jgi:hypothetical protein